MTDRMISLLFVVGFANAAGNWYRAASSGERVTLAALYRYGELQRRVWRKGRCSADNAHEYARPIYIKKGIVKP